MLIIETPNKARHSRLKMARTVIDDCLTAFKMKNYNEAVKLLPLLVEQAEIESQLWQWWPMKTVLSRYTTSIGSIDPWYHGYLEAGLLHLSSRNGWLDITRKLIEQYELDPLEGDNNGNICLHYAAAGNQLEVVKYLIRMQNVNHEVAKQTLCCIAAANESLDVMKYLIEHCYYTAYTDSRGRTVLHYGAKHISIVKYLITNCKCDPMVIDKDNKTVLNYAVQEKCLDVVEYLISINPVDKVGNTFLHLAAKTGSNDVIKQLIGDYKCNPEAINRFGQRVLHCAVEHISIVKYLITECNCDPMATDKDGKTVLHYAVRKKCSDVVEYLVSVNPVDKDENTFLHLAAKTGSNDVVNQLIGDYKCNPEATNRFGQTVLHCAVEYISIVKYLITECKCDPTVTDKYGKTVLHYAVKKKCSAVVEYLVSINPVDMVGNTFLHSAAKIGSNDVVKQLIRDYKCNPEAINRFGQRVLYCAVEHISIVKYLITECKCDPMVTDKDGKTVLHYAVRKKCSDVAEYLVSVNPVDNDGNTFLHLAAKTGSYDVVKQLIGYYKCNPKATNWFGQTVLHCAVEYISIVKYLITECKCDPMITDKDGKTVLHYAVQEKCSDVAEYLVSINQVDKDENTFLHLAAKTGSNDVVKQLIGNYKCNPKATNRFGQTVLHCAVEYVSIVEYLITKCKCDPMVIDKDGKTALHYAVQEKFSDVAEYLVSINQVDKDENTFLHLAAKTGSNDVVKQLIGNYKCNPKATNRFGQTVLHCAVEYVSIVEYLITKCKCDPMITDKDGKTALHYAVQEKFSDVAEYLVSINQVDKDENTFLHLAAKTGSNDVVKQLIGYYKCNPKATNRFGQTVLHCAVEYISIVKYLITKCKCDPMVTDKDGKTVLHFAVQEKYSDVAEYLVSINQVDNDENTFLHLAAKTGSNDVVKQLIGYYKCNPKATNRFGQTVLHCAVEYISIVKYLVTECKCDPMVTDKDGKTVLQYAVQGKFSDVAEYLVSINQVDKEENTFLHLAAKTGSYDVVKQLIGNYKFNPKAINKFGQTVLHCAVEYISIVKYLITECKCDPMVTDKDGKTVLHYAVQEKCSDVAEYLVSINQMDKEENTFLHLAAKTGSNDVVKQLIGYYKCNPKATNKFGQTVLHCAVEYISIVKYLITECKCDPMVTDKDGKTVLYYAVQEKFSDVAEYLVSINQVDKEENTFLHLAAKTGSNDVVKQLIGYYKCNPEATNRFGQTVLHCAVEYISIVKYLITECKYDPMVTDKDGKTVLHYAVQEKYSDVAEYLVSINQVDKDGNTFLHLAAKTGSNDVVKQLIGNYKCNPKAANRFGQTVLHCAVEYISIVKYLITECKCDPMVTDKDGKTVLHYAVQEKCSDVAEYLVSINQVDNDGNTFLHLAAKTGSNDVVKQLIGYYKCNPEAANRFSQTVFHCAVEYISIVKYLITECKCDPMVTDKDGKTVLHYAVQEKFSDVAEYLVSINQVDNDGNTFLHLAAKTGSNDVVKQLIGNYKCNPKAANRFGQTVLHCAVEYISIVKYLITECKCDPMVTDKDGKTVLHYAVQEKFSDVAEYLVSINQVDKDENTFLHLAAKTGSNDVVKQLIGNYKCNPKATNRFGQTVLHCAAEHISIVEYLITKCKCDPMVTDKDGKTVLHYAVQEKFSDVAEYLVSINQVDKDENTFLHLAAKTGSNDVVKQLIGNYKCNPKATNRFGQTVLHCAAEHISIVEYLITKCKCDPMVTDKDGKTVLYYAVQEKCSAVVEYLVSFNPVDKDGNTFLHLAAKTGSYDVIKQLIGIYKCNPEATNKFGKKVLHCTVENNRLDLVEYLLSTGKCDPVAKDNKGRTPLQLTDGNNRQKVQSLFKKFGQVTTSHPVDSYVNVLLLGNPGAGKSTLSKVIIDTVTGPIAFGSFSKVRGVEPCTAGIIPNKLQHKTLGNIILHDFAGHPEYYSSHSAVIENLMQGSGSVFLIVVNILEKEAVKQLHQWLTVVRNEGQKALDQCHIIVVISHVDEIIDPVERRKRKEEIRSIVGREGSVFLDCRKLGGKRVNLFFNKLFSACESIRSTSGRNLSLYCHMTYGLLEERKKNILTLSDVMTAAKDNDNYVLPDEREEVLDVLHSLDSTGLIKVLKSEDKVWVIVNKGILLFKLDGILFAPKTFKEHVGIASNTGIVSVSGLIRLFSDYDPDMLICFLKNMELCQEMSSLRMTNLIPLREMKRRGERLLFFPCLLYSDRPDEMTSQVYQFGWCLKCTREHHFFPPRYFHVLSLHLAYKLALPQEDDKLNRYCKFWRNGLHWFNGHGVGVLVEIVHNSQSVIVLMSCEEGYNMVELRRKVIGEVMSVYKESCPSLEVKELAIDPKELDYPVNTPRERTVYSVKAILSAINEGRPFVVTNKGETAVKSILPDESLVINNLSLLGGRDIKV